MIHIKRPKQAPSPLTTRGAAETKKNCAARAKGETSFAFDKGIYGHKSVKKALVEMQHGKCCFCESKVTHVSVGHVEHFRPKGGYVQKKGEKLNTPGYFWLAYEWSNLLFCCEICNSRHKGNLFPLANPKARARKPMDKLAMERAMFIDPASEDPSDHIGFHHEYPYGRTKRGEATWKALGLDREDLAERRRSALQIVQTLRLVAARSEAPALQTRATALLEEWKSERGEWSAMVRAALSA